MVEYMRFRTWKVRKINLEKFAVVIFEVKESLSSRNATKGIAIAS